MLEGFAVCGGFTSLWFRSPWSVPPFLQSTTLHPPPISYVTKIHNERNNTLSVAKPLLACYLNPITKPTPLKMCLNWLGQQVYPNHWGSWMHANYRGSQVHPNGWGSWMRPNRWGSQAWPGLGSRCTWALPSWLALCACSLWDLKLLLHWWPLF